jgi:hypothetical protein
LEKNIQPFLNKAIALSLKIDEKCAEMGKNTYKSVRNFSYTLCFCALPAFMPA